MVFWKKTDSRAWTWVYCRRLSRLSWPWWLRSSSLGSLERGLSTTRSQAWFGGWCWPRRFVFGIGVYFAARNRWAFVVIQKGTRDSDSLNASMTARITLLLVLAIQLIVWLTVAMVAIMQAMMDMLAMIGAMVWAMMGGVVGGSLGGWLGGITDVHQGASRMDNPIMVNIMALMGGAMGAMIGGGVGAYLGLLGGLGILGTIITTAVLVLAGYRLLIRGRYGLAIVSQRTVSSS